MKVKIIDHGQGLIEYFEYYWNSNFIRDNYFIKKHCYYNKNGRIEGECLEYKYKK